MKAPATTDCYVYAHQEIDGLIAYVGFGRGTRCLDPHKRKAEHVAFMKERFAACGLAFVHILHRNIDEEEARSTETRLIRSLKPRFNLQQNGAANAGRGASNHNSQFAAPLVAQLRSMYAEHDGSLRSFHRKYLNYVSYSTARKLLQGISYR